jgi:hypothetical protein
LQRVNGNINITTTGVEITPYFKHQNLYLEKLTSTYNKVTHSRDGVTGFYLDYDNSDVRFITHRHDATFLQKQFPNYQVNHIPPMKCKNLSEPISINKDITPKEVQYELIQDVLANQQYHQWFIYLSQGLGKTLLSIYLISHFNVKSLIMCYNTDILKQWYHTMKEKTDINPKKILMIDSSSIFKAILLGKFPVWEYDIFMCTPGIITSFAKKHGFHLMAPLMEKMGIGFKIYDEAHRNITNIIKINAMTSIDKTLYLSGDFGQSARDKEKLYYNMFYGVPILKPSEELMNTLKFTTAIVMMYNSKPSELDRASIYTRRGISFYEYMKYQFRTEIFFDVLDYTIKMIGKTNFNHYKILILVNLIDHVDELYDRMQNEYGDSYIIGRYHSGVPEDEKTFCKESCNMIISTYQSFSTGIDVSLIKYVISCSICTKIEDNQSSGRARPLPDGSDAFYFMFADMGFSYTKKKLSSRLGYLQETKIKDIKTVKYE